MAKEPKVGTKTVPELDALFRSGTQAKDVAAEAGLQPTKIYLDLQLAGGFKVATVRFIVDNDGKPVGGPITEADLKAAGKRACK